MTLDDDETDHGDECSSSSSDKTTTPATSVHGRPMQQSRVVLELLEETSFHVESTFASLVGFFLLRLEACLKT